MELAGRMTSAFDSFNASPLGDFIQSGLDARGGAKTHDIFISETLRQNNILTKTVSYPVTAETGVTRSGYIRNNFQEWPPVVGTLTVNTAYVLVGAERYEDNRYLRRGQIQWSIPAGFPTGPVKVELYVAELLDPLNYEEFTLLLFEVANFEPLSTGDYDVSGTQVGSLGITLGMSAQVYTIVLSGATITPGSYYSLQLRTSRESGSDLPEENDFEGYYSLAEISPGSSKLIVGY